MKKRRVWLNLLREYLQMLMSVSAFLFLYNRECHASGISLGAASGGMDNSYRFRHCCFTRTYRCLLLELLFETVHLLMGLEIFGLIVLPQKKQSPKSECLKNAVTETVADN